jgi:Holliday junction resolvasome RuvABC endonuclease subunit
VKRSRVKRGTAPSTLNALGKAILRREAQASAELDRGDARTYSLATCSLCGLTGTAGSEVTYSVAWLCRAPFGCAAAPAASADELAEQAELEADLAAPEMGMDEPLIIRSQAELDALLGQGALRFPTTPPASGLQVAVDDAAARLAAELTQEGADCERYIGIDPGLAHLGIFVLGLSARSVRCLYRETFTTTPEAGTDEQRLALIARRLNELVSYWRPTAIGYEDVRSITTGKEKAGAGNADRGPLLMICGMLISEAWRHETPVYRIANQSGRVAVLGKGKSRGATKVTVRDRVQELTGTRKLTLDQGDAGAIAFGTYVKHRDRNLKVRLPSKRRKR